jgi:hypothetical protein
MTFNSALSYVLLLIHAIVSIVVFIGPYVTKNKLFLRSLILYYVAILTMWHMNGRCIWTDFENTLNGKKHSKKSAVTDLFKSLFGKYTETIFSMTPLINTAVCLYKL